TADGRLGVAGLAARDVSLGTTHLGRPEQLAEGASDQGQTLLEGLAARQTPLRLKESEVDQVRDLVLDRRRQLQRGEGGAATGLREMHEIQVTGALGRARSIGWARR